jgi:hypothetical protein
MKIITIRNCVKIAALLACVFHAQGSWSASFSLNPGADAFVTAGSSGDLSHNNYGAAGALSLAAPGLSSGERLARLIDTVPPLPPTLNE